MKYAAVIAVGRRHNSVSQALRTQSLLLDRMGEKLASVRLAIPRLLDAACTAAVADCPDIMVVAGGQRTARIAGQIAHRFHVPILFLPGARPPVWGAQIWGSLALEDMIDHLSHDRIRLTRLGVGAVGDEIFFGDARFGLLPQLAHLHDAFNEADTLSEGCDVLKHAASLTRCIGGTRLAIAPAKQEALRMSTLVVAAQGEDGNMGFQCSVWKHRNFAHCLLAILKAAAGRDWQKTAVPKCFACEELTVAPRAARWFVLDGDPVRFERPAVLRFLPDEVRACVFRREH